MFPFKTGVILQCKISNSSLIFFYQLRLGDWKNPLIGPGSITEHITLMWLLPGVNPFDEDEAAAERT